MAFDYNGIDVVLQTREDSVAPGEGENRLLICGIVLQASRIKT